MNWYIIAALIMLPFTVGGDPAPGLGRSKQASRQLDCTRVSPEEGIRRYPGVIKESKPRGDFADRSVLACTGRFVEDGLRVERDEAVLRELEVLVQDIAANAAAERPELSERTWLVETHLPSAEVSHKVGFATKNALVGQGLLVSDRTPVLGASDIGVLTRMDPDQAYPAACRRYADNGSIGESHALLAVLVRDPRQTVLNAGLCVDGQWSWLQ